MLEIDNRRLVTTQLILVEIGNGLSSRQFRQKAASIIRNLQEDPIVDVIPVTPAAFSLALVVVMRDIGLSDALTTDDHFRQAGFNALLLG